MKIENYIYSIVLQFAAPRREPRFRNEQSEEVTVKERDKRWGTR